MDIIAVDRNNETKENTSYFMPVTVSVLLFVFQKTGIYFLIHKISGEEWKLPELEFEHGLTLEEAAQAAIKKISRFMPQNLHQIGTIYNISEKSQHGNLKVVFLSTMYVPVDIKEISEIKSEDVTDEEIKWIAANSDFSFLQQEDIDIVRKGFATLKNLSRFDKIVFSLLPQEFSLGELQKLFEVIVGKKMDVRNFRKKIESMDILRPSEIKPRGMAHRPPRLFVFDNNRFLKLAEKDPELRFF